MGGPSMKIEARATEKEHPFANSQRVFDGLTEQLSSERVLRMTHGDLERLLDKDGREIIRQLFQDHLDLRGQGQTEAPVIGAHGIRRPHERLRQRNLKTLFGEVKVLRMGYSAHGEETLFPRDAELNLPNEVYSHGIERRVAEEVAKVSFDQSVATIAATTGATVPKRQAEEVAVRGALDFDDFYAAQAVDSRRDAAKSGEILVISTDGKGIVMRPKALRESTRRAAETQNHKLSKRLSPGEKQSRKRMAQVVAVYTIAPFIRRPEDFVRDLRPMRDITDLPARPRPEHKRLWASIEKSTDEVIDTMFEEALLRDPVGDKHWVALIDGNPSQLSCIKAAAKRFAVKPTIILDIIHVIEYLWCAGIALHGEGETKTQRWVSERLFQILCGKSSQVAAGMRRSATIRQLTPRERTGVDKCANYLLKYRRYLCYDKYLAQGYPISTGVIEGACRYLVKDRMDITGARWGLSGAEAVLKLRAIHASGDSDAYWRFHEHAHYTRQHLDLYDSAPPSTVMPLISRNRKHLRLVP
jgi:hypothetical protein